MPNVITHIYFNNDKGTKNDKNFQNIFVKKINFTLKCSGQ